MTDLICTRPARPQVRFWGEADMDRQAKPAGLVENDPLRHTPERNPALQQAPGLVAPPVTKIRGSKRATR
jgi:hypothetical protein